jgi:cellulose synthase/poly-beta-1,6-N-acetylglucosamine synthase-like glycosyltransferase
MNNTLENLPSVSILIPARNEFQNLPYLFASIDNLNYPKDRFEVLLGNDQSEDKSLEIMLDFAVDKPWITVFDVPKGNLNGKTNVLNFLAQKAKGEFLLFTDADIILPKEWINGMIKEFENQPKLGVVIGVTAMNNNFFKSAMQSLEWLIVLSVSKILSDFKIPTTGMGNNMAVRSSAYFKIGGYEKIGFSIVEDYLLYKEIIKAGFGFKQAFNSSVLAFTKPPEHFFIQRNRWLKGAIEQNPRPLFLGFLQAIAFPIYILMAFYDIKYTLALWVFSLLLYAGFCIYFERKLKINGYLKWIPLFTFYLPTAWFLQFLYFMINRKVNWKGRAY